MNHSRLRREREIKMDEMELLAADLVKAWRRYRELFGDDPHGTEQQMRALLALTRKYGAVMQKPNPGIES
jgi:hypothetical protein